MNTTKLHSVLLPLMAGLLHSSFDQLHSVIDNICQTDCPRFVLYGGQISPSVEFLLHRYLTNSSRSRTIITDLNRTVHQIILESCLLLFADEPFSANLLKAKPEHRKLVISAEGPSDSILREIIQNDVFETFFLTLNQSDAWTVYYYDHFAKNHHRWTELPANALRIAELRNLEGSKFRVTMNGRLESIFAKFISTEMNITLDLNHKSASGAGLFYGQLIVRILPNYHFVYMHQSSQLRVLVPRLDVPLPMIAVMVDPFDTTTWMLYGAMILTAAFFRMCCARRFTAQQFLGSLQDVVLSTILNRPIGFYRQLDQLVIAFLKLLSVVLMAAYSSLVISFLLNPRFHPELDTLELVNDSCCWWWGIKVQALNFRHIDECLSVTFDSKYIPKANDRGQFQCYLVDSMMETMAEEMLSDRAIATHYRWSKVTVQQYPIITIAVGGAQLVKRIKFYAALFFAEGGLHQVFSEDSEQFENEGNFSDTPIAVEDLSLLWTAYCLGIGISVTFFVSELAARDVRTARRLKWLQFKPNF